VVLLVEGRVAALGGRAVEGGEGDGGGGGDGRRALERAAHLDGADGLAAAERAVLGAARLGRRRGAQSAPPQAAPLAAHRVRGVKAPVQLRQPPRRPHDLVVHGQDGAGGQVERACDATMLSHHPTWPHSRKILTQHSVNLVVNVLRDLTYEARFKGLLGQDN